MDLISPLPRMNFFDARFPIYTHPRFLPGSKVRRGTVENSILGGGCIIDRANISKSIIGIRSRIGAGATIDRSLIFGADYYEFDARKPAGGIPLGIGPKSVISKAIIDTNVRIGRGVVLANRRKYRKYDDPDGRIYVRNGIIVIPKGAVIPDGTVF
jgi:glucose-1-phosphate adenylyltransferase